MKYFAFRKIDGSIHVEGYNEIMPDVDPLLEKLYGDWTVDEILSPFIADNIEKAKKFAKDKLKSNFKLRERKFIR